MDQPAVTVQPLERVPDQLHADVTSDLVERIVMGRGVGKRLPDPHRSVDELGRFGQKRGGDSLAGEVAQRERRLEAGDASADDHYTERCVRSRSHAASLWLDFPRATRAAPNRAAENYLEAAGVARARAQRAGLCRRTRGNLP